jgi:hypothetical protein
MKFILFFLLMSTYSIAQTTKDGSTSSSSNTSATRSSYDVGDYQIDGVSATEKLNQAKQGQFNNVTYNAASAPTGGCSVTCDCPGTYDVCQGGTCVNISTGGGGCNPSFSGQLVRGDSSCQYLCNGSMFVCPASGASCGGGGGK